jgi:hypothetical protein
MTRFVLGAVLCASLLLAGCESSEERAEKHFQDGVELLEAGDVDRALVEFRNVFQLDGTHKEARRLYAQAEIDRGNIPAGYGVAFRAPAGITYADVDPVSGQLATPLCASVVREPFVDGSAPTELCHLHRGPGAVHPAAGHEFPGETSPPPPTVSIIAQ